MEGDEFDEGDGFPTPKYNKCVFFLTSSCSYFLVIVMLLEPLMLCKNERLLIHDVNKLLDIYTIFESDMHGGFSVYLITSSFGNHDAQSWQKQIKQEKEKKNQKRKRIN